MVRDPMFMGNPNGAMTRSTVGEDAEFPLGATDRRGVFDRFADWMARVTGEALFFTVCLAIVVVWAPSYFAFGNINTWQLVINTLTTIVTFLLVALIQNTQRRSDLALQRKLNAIAAALGDLMEHAARDDPALGEDIEHLKDAVGLEHRVSA